MRSLYRHVMIIALVVLAASGAFAQVNTVPKPNVLGQNGLAAPQTLSTDPQISQCAFDSTGVTFTSATTTTIADATHFPCTTKRGATVSTSSTGFESIRRNGLYAVYINGNCTGVTTETVEIVGQISTDGGTNWTQITGAQARFKALTGTLQQNISAIGLVEVSQTSTNLSAGNVVVALRGSSSGGSAATCANGAGIIVQRLDVSQPVTYP